MFSYQTDERRAQSTYEAGLIGGHTIIDSLGGGGGDGFFSTENLQVYFNSNIYKICKLFLLF